MNDEWNKIKSCFGAMASAPEAPPQSAVTTKQLSQAAARYMKPRGDSGTIRKMTERIQFICFGE